MIINHLAILPTEDQLSDFVVSIFKDNPKLIFAFANKFTTESFPESSFEIFSRKQLSAIPGIEPSSFGSLKPDIVMKTQSHLLIFENKRDAALKATQLSSYIQGVQALKKEKSIHYFLIAPRTSRYTALPKEYVQVTWDQLYQFFQNQGCKFSDSILSRFRLFFYQEIFDQVISLLRSEFSEISYGTSEPTSDYHGIHFKLPQSSIVVFSLAIFLQSPSYIKLFPFKVRYEGKLIKFNDGHPIIRNYRSALQTLPRTAHMLKASYPGYVVDMYPYPENNVENLINEIRSLLKNECQEMISLYHP